VADCGSLPPTCPTSHPLIVTHGLALSRIAMPGAVTACITGARAVSRTREKNTQSNLRCEAVIHTIALRDCGAIRSLGTAYEPRRFCSRSVIFSFLCVGVLEATSRSFSRCGCLRTEYRCSFPNHGWRGGGDG